MIIFFFSFNLRNLHLRQAKRRICLVDGRAGTLRTASHYLMKIKRFNTNIIIN